MANTALIKLMIGVGVVVVLLIVIIVPISFSSVEYYEYGFVKQKSTSKVDLTKVYGPGKHFIGPDYEFKKFRADSHRVDLDQIAAFTRDKLEVKVTATYQYFLRMDDLPLLHAAYDLYYKDVMESRGVDALKSAVTQFTKSELFLNRSVVEETLFTAVRQRLGGICCTPACEKLPHGCLKNCKKIGCETKDKGAFAEVKFFQLKDIYIPDAVVSNFMKTLLESELALKEKYIQDAQITRKNTDQLVRMIKNEATEISESATATSQSIKSKSQANYVNIIEKARSEGLKHLYEGLNITDQNQKNSFDYLRTLRGLDNVHLTVDFQQRIAGNL